MAASPSGEKAKSTIVIKRIKKGGHGGHSAAWKIAYADFVTAMMAFFLLMWLLGSTTKGDLQGIAEYFQSPLQIAMGGGSGSGDATSVITGGGTDLTRSAGQVKRGSNDSKKKTPYQLRKELEQAERENMQRLKARVDAAIFVNTKLSEFRNQVRVEITPDGLRIQIIDDFNRPMFTLGGAAVQPYMRDILHEIGKVLNDVDNKITLSGHTDSTQYAAGDRSYSNWELSADRANASRRELITGGMNADKVVRVVGLADSALLLKDDPKSPLNRRISIVVLNKLAEERLAQAGGEIEAGTVGEVRDALPEAANTTTSAPATSAATPAVSSGADASEASPVDAAALSTMPTNTPTPPAP